MKDRALSERLVGNLLRPVLIASMMTCLAAPVIIFFEQIMTGWNGSYYLVFAFAAALEGILSERLLQRQRITGWAYLASRGAELLILLLVLKMANYLPLGLDQLRADASTWTTYLEGFITPVDLLTGLLFVPLWLGALFVARQASELEVVPHRAEPPADKTSVEYYLWLTQPPLVRDRELALARLGETFVWGGIAILLASALLHFMLPDRGVPAFPVLLYFALGVALLSQARFSVTHTGWQAQGLSIQPGIARRWLSWAVVFLVGVVLVALLLPTGYSMGPVLAIYSLLAFLAQVFTALLVLGTYLLALLLSWLLPSAVTPPSPPRELMPAQSAERLADATPLPWLEAIGSALFWTVISVIVVYALVRFVRDRLGPLDSWDKVSGTWWGRFLLWLRALWWRWLAWEQGIQLRLARPRGEAGARLLTSARLAHFFSLGRVSPREMITYFYLSITRRAAQAGRARQPHQTPYEYQADLASHFPELEPDLSGLTEAFVQARYDNRRLNSKDADAVKPLWQRIKSALRRRRVKA